MAYMCLSRSTEWTDVLSFEYCFEPLRSFSHLFKYFGTHVMLKSFNEVLLSLCLHVLTVNIIYVLTDHLCRRDLFWCWRWWTGQCVCEKDSETATVDKERCTQLFNEATVQNTKLVLKMFLCIHCIYYMQRVQGLHKWTFVCVTVD